MPRAANPKSRSKLSRRMGLYIGTSGWSYPSWKPAFYPEKLAQSKFLEHYATRLTAVEVNASFRRLPAESAEEKWIAATPPRFRFAFKAHQAITHFKRLKEAGPSLKRLLESLQPISSAGRLGPVLFQLPPNFQADPERLDTFLQELPRGIAAAFEFRHESWLRDEVFEILKRRRVALCIAETDTLETPEVQTANFLYFRFRRSEYSKRERRAVAERLERWLRSGPDVYAFFKHEERPESALWAEEILKAIPAAERAA